MHGQQNIKILLRPDSLRRRLYGPFETSVKYLSAVKRSSLFWDVTQRNWQLTTFRDNLLVASSRTAWRRNVGD